MVGIANIYLPIGMYCLYISESLLEYSYIATVQFNLFGCRKCLGIETESDFKCQKYKRINTYTDEIKKRTGKAGTHTHTHTR